MSNDSRKLGEQEQMMHFTHGFGALIPAQVLHIRGIVEAGLLRRALDWLQRQHAMLRAHVRYGELVVRGTSPTSTASPISTPTARQRSARRGDRTMGGRLLRRDAQAMRRGRTPRLRFTLVRDAADPDMTRIVMASDHAVFDAQAAYLINRDMLAYFADPAAMEARPPQSETLPRPLDQAQPVKSRSGRRGYEPALRLPRQRVPGGRRRTRVLSRQLDQARTDALRQAVKANRATLHGAITAAFFLAMHERYGLEAMSCLSSVDLRRLCTPPLPQDTIGCYIDILRTTHRLATDFWTLARDVSFKLITTIAKDQEIASFMRMPNLEAYKAEWWPTMTHHRRLDGLGVTTAGDSGLRSVYGGYVLEGVAMATSVDLFGPGLLVLAAERQGALDISICYSEDALPAADAGGTADRALALLAAQEAEVALA